MIDNKSPKEQTVESKLTELVDTIVAKYTDGDDLPKRLLDAMLNNAEIEAIQNYANNVSITRIGLNDHGPVHMKTVCRNAMKMLSLLHESGIETSIEKEH